MAETACRENSRITAPPLEKSITSSILRYLNSLPDCYAVKTRGDYRQAGQPDILGCYRGRTLALEVKRPGGKITALQAATLDKWKTAGAVAGMVMSVEETKTLLKSITVKKGGE